MDLKQKLAQHQRELQKAQETVLRIQGAILLLRDLMREEQAEATRVEAPDPE